VWGDFPLRQPLSAETTPTGAEQQHTSGTGAPM